MTDRVNAFVVVLGEDRRDDDIDAIVTALRMVSGVIAVEPHVTDIGEIVAQERADREWRDRIYDLIRPPR